MNARRKFCLMVVGRLSPCEQKSISVPACNISMGQTPRSVFPLVVLIYDSNLSCDEFADSTVVRLIESTNSLLYSLKSESVF